jgi:hypothetical protein
MKKEYPTHTVESSRKKTHLSHPVKLELSMANMVNSSKPKMCPVMCKGYHSKIRVNAFSIVMNYVCSCI